MNKFAVVGAFIVFLLIGYLLSAAYGVGGFGPTVTQDVTVFRTYIDIGGEKKTESHYVVVTDKGSFEVDNGLLLGMWNADDIFGQMQQGKKYRITSKGKRYQNMFMQEFPYIIKVENIP